MILGQGENAGVQDFIFFFSSTIFSVAFLYIAAQARFDVDLTTSRGKNNSSHMFSIHETHFFLVTMNLSSASAFN